MFKLKITLQLKDKIAINNLQDFLTLQIKKALNHKEDSLYCFDTFFSKETDGFYKANTDYNFEIRSFNIDLLLAIQENLKTFNAKIICSKIEELKISFIKELKTTNPVIISLKKRSPQDKQLYWTNNFESLDYLKEAIERNLCKKMNIEYKSFIEEVIQTNRIPIKRVVTDFLYIGNTFIFKIKEDLESQKLTNYMYALGAGEYNKRGFGFCIKK